MNPEDESRFIEISDSGSDTPSNLEKECHHPNPFNYPIAISINKCAAPNYS